MTTEERIANLEKRVLELENLVKWTAVTKWVMTDGEQMIQMQKAADEIIRKKDYEKLSDDEKAEIDLVINTFRKTNRLLEFIITWSESIQPLPELGLDEESKK